MERFSINLNTNTFKIFTSIEQLPDTWDKVAHENAFLQTDYLSVLENSAPLNMTCFYIGIYENESLTGVALAQYLNINKLDSFGKRDKCIKTIIRNFVFKNFASHTLIIGNNMITGQNGFAFNKQIESRCISDVLLDCANELISYFNNKNIKIHIVSFKDFYQKNADLFRQNAFKEMHVFNVQPNMIFELNSNWNNFEDYVSDFTKKYRDQYKRARKKIDGIIIKELNYDEIVQSEKRIYELYYHVANNAPFNTFFLAENHFSTFKKECKNDFVFYGYYFQDNLVGFHTLLLNGDVLETYFLGYDDVIQKEKMLYLNMLYNLTQFAIENKFKKVIFGRTALEIKSSIGAKPIKMYGFIFHTNKLINKYIGRIFDNLEPKLEWQERHPFK